MTQDDAAPVVFEGVEFRLVFEASGTVGRGTAKETGEEIKAREEDTK